VTRTRLSRQELYELVWAAPVRQIAPRYGVSDVGFAKACRAANIPLPPRGYWAKRQAGHDVPRPPLPRPSTPGQDHVVIGQTATAPTARRRDLEPADLSSLPAVSVPQQLRQPHAVVAATRDRLKELRPGADGRLFLRDDRGCFGLRVGPQSVRRALLILHAICTEAERRGWSVVSAGADGYRRTASAGIRIGRHTYPVSIEERTTSSPPSEEEVRRWQSTKPQWEKRDSPPARRTPTGRLVLQIPDSWGGNRDKWADIRQVTVEAMLGDFFATLATRAVDDQGRFERAERERVEREERERRERIRRARTDRLQKEVADWEAAERIREYIARLQIRLEGVSPPDRDRLAEWCAWALGRADELDPTVNVSKVVGFDDARDQYWLPPRPPY